MSCDNSWNPIMTIYDFNDKMLSEILKTNDIGKWIFNNFNTIFFIIYKLEEFLINKKVKTLKIIVP